ncbi:hypothetical protein LWI29_036285 [Acer saccharum]|uniref:IP5PC-F beta-propeller domain-containing protein n=1 Tax=Acer saccharum TaxID=4024 RepID=A0AA39W985_ACESA|nr:hypothetical protein LWI29_036285 [Acer saccharum]
MRAAYGGLLSKTLALSAPNHPPSILGFLGTRSLGIRATKPKMEKNNREEQENVSMEKKENVINSNLKVNRMQQLMDGHSSGGWEKALVPACGTGYDAVAMASPERHIVGLEISDIAIEKAKEFSSSLPNANYVTFLKADFFTWCPTELFDLIFDYTFFCAIEPDMRLAWAQKIRDILKPNGELITLMFPISDHIGGPPYKVSVSDYKEVLHPVGFRPISIVDNELAVGPRRGREKLGRWKRSQLYNDHLYDSSDDDFFARGPSSTADIDKDYITQSIYIDDDDADQPDQRQLHPLPEFVGSGEVPTRSAVHPGRPPCLELRPHPLRETQVGKFLRNIACTETQLWAGQVSGVRYWNFDIACDVGCGLSNRLRRGDEDAAPFHESVNTSPTTCLMVDSGNKLVFSGHKDGKIRSWKTDQSLEDNNNPLREGLSWQAHRGPVLAMLFSSHGDLWSGGEGGIIKIWPWESIEKSLS